MQFWILCALLNDPTSSKNLLRKLMQHFSTKGSLNSEALVKSRLRTQQVLGFFFWWFKCTVRFLYSYLQVPKLLFLILDFFFNVANELTSLKGYDKISVCISFLIIRKTRSYCSHDIYEQITMEVWYVAYTFFCEV